MTKTEELAQLDRFIAAMRGTYIGDSLAALRVEIEQNIRADFPAIDFPDVQARLQALRHEHTQAAADLRRLTEERATLADLITGQQSQLDALERKIWQARAELKHQAMETLGQLRTWATLP